jgi:hypothetical protein
VVGGCLGCAPPCGSGRVRVVLVVYGCEGGLVLVVVVLICVRIGFLCRFEG